MKEDRPSSLALIYNHKDVEIKDEDIIDRFASKSWKIDFFLVSFIYHCI